MSYFIEVAQGRKGASLKRLEKTRARGREFDKVRQDRNSRKLPPLEVKLENNQKGRSRPRDLEDSSTRKCGRRRLQKLLDVMNSEAFHSVSLLVHDVVCNHLFVFYAVSNTTYTSTGVL